MESQPTETTPNPEEQSAPTTVQTNGPTNGERVAERARETRHWFTITELNEMKVPELRKAAESLAVKDAKDAKARTKISAPSPSQPSLPSRDISR